MPKRYARICLLSLLPGLALAGPAEAELARRLDALLAAQPAFSGELLLVQGEQTLYQRSQTLVERSDAPPPDRPYQYRVGSISKQLTAVLVLSAAAKGQLDLEQALDSELTGLPAGAHNTVSAAQLLNHSAGLIEPGQPPQFVPGSRFGYANHGYVLLGEWLSRVTGQSYTAQANALLARCQMHQSTMPAPATAAERRQRYPQLRDGYVQRGTAAAERLEWAITPAQRPSGGLLASAADLVRWSRCLHAGPALAPAQYAYLTTPRIERPHRWGLLGYGAGLQVLQRDGLLEYSHGGYVPGYMSTLLYYPSQSFSVVVLENTSYPERDIAQAYALHDQVRLLARDYLRAGAPLSPQP